MISRILKLGRGGKTERPSLLRFFFVFMILLISTRSANAQGDQLESANSTSSNFQPSLFVVIGVLSFMFSLTFLLLLYAKMCYREPTAIYADTGNQNNNNVSNRGMFGTHTRFSGLNIEVVESLPFFRFSSLKGAKQGLQCSVCLAEFEDIEILRLLPKCKHGFHIECIDQWLENHSTCPLCRQKVSADDLIKLVNSSSMRLIIEGSKSVADDDAGEAASSSFELFIEREDEQKSSRFSIGGSFRKILINSRKDEIVNIEVEPCNLHRLNHQIIVSDVVFKHRWSDLSSSDLMFLNSEMLGIMSSDRVCSSKTMLGTKSGCNDDDSRHHSITNIKEEMERKRVFEHKVGQIKRCSSNSSTNADSGFDSSCRQIISSTGDQNKRAMSEITAISRQCLKEADNDEIKRRRRRWFPIARRTVQWFANRENYRSQQSQDTGQILLDV